MKSPDSVIAQISAAFAAVPPPPSWSLSGSREGNEPELLERAFRDKLDWRLLEPRFLDSAPDGHASALSFLSDEALRFFLPAYLVADLNGQLREVDVLNHVTGWLGNEARTQLLNPRRFGNRSWFESQSHRFSVFDAHQCQAIVAYIEFKISSGELLDSERKRAEEALNNFWRPRANG